MKPSNKLASHFTKEYGALKKIELEQEEFSLKLLQKIFILTYEMQLKTNKTIALYAAGTHTKWILPALFKAKIQPFCIFDDSPACDEILGVPVYSTDELQKHNIDCLIISSDRFHAKIYKKLTKQRLHSTVVDPYKGLRLKLLSKLEEKEASPGKPLPKTIQHLFESPSAQTNTKICIFAQFDKTPKIRPYIFYFLNEIKKQGFSIYYVSTAPLADHTQIDELLGICDKVIFRSNIGYDFGSWKVGLDLIPNNTDQVLLTNDSIYGPLYDLTNLFDAYNDSNCDFYGASDSYETGYYHLQSYFMIFSKTILNSKCWSQFWENIKVYKNKTDLIQNLEVGLSRILHYNGFKLGAFCKNHDIAHEAILKNHYYSYKLITKRNYNITHLLWDFIIYNSQFPFIKKDLLATNPLGLNNLDELEAIINLTKYDINLLKE